MSSRTNGVLRKVIEGGRSQSTVTVPPRTMVLTWEAGKVNQRFKVHFPGQTIQRVEYDEAYAAGRVITVGGKPFVYTKPADERFPASRVHVSCVDNGGRVEYRMEHEAQMEKRLKAETHAADWASLMAEGYSSAQVEKLNEAVGEGLMRTAVEWTRDAVGVLEERLLCRFPEPRKEAKGSLRSFIQSLFHMKASDTEMKTALSAVGIQPPAEASRTILHGARVILGKIGFPDELLVESRFTKVSVDEGVVDISGSPDDNGHLTTAEAEEIDTTERSESVPEAEAAAAEELVATDSATNSDPESPRKKSRRKKAELAAA